MTRFDRARWQAVSPLLGELLDATPAERQQRLAEISAEDGALGADLASLLALQAQVETEGFLESTALDVVAHELSLAGRAVGNYTLERELGAGGMGTVWLARRSDGRYQGSVAVKLLNLGLLGRTGAQRFRREGNALARLAHPNIARLIDAGDVDGHPYLVIEYVDGLPIDAWCDTRTLGVEARIRLFLQVLSAVAYAHSQLILHRDLKPSNILVTTGGDVKLLDFGIAKLLAEESSTAPRTELTQLGGRALTPDYAAPEQVQGADVSTATDVYALGVLLFQLLAGAHPTARPAQTPVERLRAIVEGDPIRASEAARAGGADVATRRATTPDRLARVLRGDLENILATALRKAPGERYANAAALADDLRRVLDHEPVRAHKDSVGYRVGKFIRRNRIAVAAAGSAAVALLAISAVATWQMVEAQRQREAAELEAKRAASARDFLHFVLSQVGATDRPFTTRELLAQAEQSIEGHFGSLDDPLAIEQLSQLSELYSAVSEPAKAMDLAETAYRRATSAGFGDIARSAACSLGNQLATAGKAEQARELLDRTLADLRARPTESAALVACLQFRADLALTLGDSAAGVALAEEGVALTANRELRDSPAAQIPIRMQLAISYRVAGETQRADRAYQDLQVEFKRLGREHTVDAVVAASNWGKLKADAGDILGGSRLIESALRAGQGVRPGETTDYVTATNYAQRLLSLNRLDESWRYFADARQGAEKEHDPNIELIAMLGLAAVQRERGDHAAAQASLDRARAFAERNFPAPDHRAHAAVLQETGRLLLAQGAFVEAKAALSEVATRLQAGRSKDPAIVTTLLALAEIETKLGNLEPAAALAAEARTRADELALPGAPSYWVGSALLVQAGIEQARGRSDAAHQSAAQAVEQLQPTVGADHVLVRKARAAAGG
jgi:serine/threonine-protein kinase